MATTGYTQHKDCLRSLENYKEIHAAKAKEDGKYEELMRCKTITQAKAVLYGVKTKNFEAQRKKGSVKK